MTFKTSYNSGLGMPAFSLAAVDTTPRVAIGTILKGFDDVLGEGEFIYLPGLAATAAGDAVAYDLLPGAPFTTRLSNAVQAGFGCPVAVALAATLAGQYGWYQIGGVAIVNVIAGTTAASRAFMSATVGQLGSTQGNGSQIIGARFSSAVGTPAAGQAYITLNRPFAQGQIL